MNEALFRVGRIVLYRRNEFVVTRVFGVACEIKRMGEDPLYVSQDDLDPMPDGRAITSWDKCIWKPEAIRRRSDGN